MIVIKFKDVFELLTKDCGLHDYPIILIKDLSGNTISTERIKYKDLTKLYNVDVNSISTSLPLTVSVNWVFPSDMEGVICHQK